MRYRFYLLRRGHKSRALRGLWHSPGALVALFVLFGGVLVAMALRWPRDIGGALTYAVSWASCWR
jgi:hypothetical protein